MVLSIILLCAVASSDPTVICIEEEKTPPTCSGSGDVTKKPDDIEGIKTALKGATGSVELKVYNAPTAAVSLAEFTLAISITGFGSEAPKLLLEFDEDLAKSPLSMSLTNIVIGTNKLVTSSLEVKAGAKITAASGVPTVVSPAVDVSAVTWTNMFSVDLQDPPLDASGAGTATTITFADVDTSESVTMTYGSKTLTMKSGSVSVKITGNSPQTIAAKISVSAGEIITQYSDGTNVKEFVKTEVEVKTTGKLTFSGKAWSQLSTTFITCKLTAGTVTMSTANIPASLTAVAGDLVIGAEQVSMIGSITPASGFTVKYTEATPATFEFQSVAGSAQLTATGEKLSVYAREQTNTFPFDTTAGSSAKFFVKKFVWTSATAAAPTGLKLAPNAVISIPLSLGSETPPVFSTKSITDSSIDMPSEGTAYTVFIDSSGISKDASEISFMSYKKLKDVNLDLLCLTTAAVSSIDLSRWKLDFPTEGGAGFAKGAAGFAKLEKTGDDSTMKYCVKLGVDYYPDGTVEELCYGTGCAAATQTVITDATDLAKLSTKVDAHTKYFKIELKESVPQANAIDISSLPTKAQSIVVVGNEVTEPAPDPAGAILAATVNVNARAYIKMNDAVSAKVERLELQKSRVTLVADQASAVTVAVDQFVMSGCDFTDMGQATITFTGSKTSLSASNLAQIKDYSAKSLEILVSDAVAKVVFKAEGWELHKAAVPGTPARILAGAATSTLIAEISSAKASTRTSFTSNAVSFEVATGVASIPGFDCEITPESGSSSSTVTFDKASWALVTSNTNGVTIAHTQELKLADVPNSAHLTFEGPGKVTLTSVEKDFKFSRPLIVAHSDEELHVGKAGNTIKFSKIVYQSGDAKLVLHDAGSSATVLSLNADVVEVAKSSAATSDDLAVNSEILMQEGSSMNAKKLNFGTSKSVNVTLNYEVNTVPYVITDTTENLGMPGSITMNYTRTPTTTATVSDFDPYVNRAQPVFCAKTMKCADYVDLLSFSSVYSDFDGETAKFTKACTKVADLADSPAKTAITTGGATTCLTVTLTAVPGDSVVGGDASQPAGIPPTDKKKGPNVGAIVGGVVGGVAVVTIVTVVSVVLVRRKKKQGVEAPSA